MSVLFVVAHPDDEAYGPAGTIAKLAEKETVVVMSLCNGNKIGADPYIGSNRRDAFTASCRKLGTSGSVLRQHDDLTLTYRETIEEIDKVVSKVKPRAIYTHNISDINADHRLVAEACMVVARPKPESFVEELYFFEVPSSTDWAFNQLGKTFEPNVYENISDYWYKKQQVLELYETETYEFPDARSVEATETLAKYRGYQCGVRYAEAFRLVFSLDRKSQ